MPAGTFQVQTIPAYPFGGTGTANGSLPGATPYNYNPAFGGIPQQPNPTNTAGQATTGNLANLGNIQKLAEMVDNLNRTMTKANTAAYVPNLDNLLGQDSTNIKSNLGGNISDSTRRAMEIAAAERGSSLGYGVDSPNADAALLRAIGQTSEQLQALGHNQLSNAISRVPSIPLYNPAQMFVTPQDQQNAQQRANDLNAAPIPSQAASMNWNAMLAGMNNGRNQAGGTTNGMFPTVPERDMSWFYERPANYSMLDGTNLNPGFGNTPAQGSDWSWNDTVGGYVNSLGQISDTPGQTPLWDYTLADYMTPAMDTDFYGQPLTADQEMDLWWENGGIG